jgi:hypothetical protein
VPCTGVLHVVTGVFSQGSPANLGGFNLDTAMDSHGNALSVGINGTAFIGGVDQVLGFGTTDLRLFVTASALRAYVPTDYHAGDTIDLTWNFPDPGAIQNAALALATIGSTVTADPQTFLGAGPAVEYGNGDSYPDVSLSASSLSWQLDYGDSPVPLDDSMLLVAHASHPAQSAPAILGAGAVGAVSGADFTLAASLRAFVPAGTAIDPTASWGSPADALAGNYQFAKV